jgi:TolB-like protein/DNA-binding winged helix-turn-helix (wHTH) protein/Tfp pilus assembly protein PilF
LLRYAEVDVECYTFVWGIDVVSGPAGTFNPIRFGDDFELDPRMGELRRSGRVLRLERIPMQILLLLVEQKEGLVTREQIVDKIWGKDVHLDTDNSINGAIRKIRQVLRDDPEQPRFVQTITGRGYRFIAAVGESDRAKQSSATGTSLAHVPSSSRPLRDTLPWNPPVRWRAAVILAGAVLVIAGLWAYFHWSRSSAHARPSTGRLMLAVLPFQNLTGDADQDYFSDGLTEEMITQLGNLDPQHLGVIARTSVMHYKHSEEPLDQIGRTLGVQYVLEGSVRREADKVRITAQLIQLKDQSHLWAREYDRELSNVLVLQGEIAQDVANKIQLTLGDGHPPAGLGVQPAHSSRSVEAYELYLKGRYFWNKRTAQGLRQAIGYFQQAIDRDPNYARAYAGLAESYALMGGYSVSPQSESMSKARTAAQGALQLDDQLPEAHTALAFIAENYDWDWQTAEKEYRRAIQLDPNDATGHHWYAECLALQGRFNEAFTEIERARQLDPLSLIIAADKGAFLYFSRQYDPAVEQFRAVLEMEPNFPRAQMLLYVYVQKGMFAEALADAEAWNRRDPTPWSWALLAYAYGRSGNPVKASFALQQLEQLNHRDPRDPLCFFVAYIGLDDKDKAMASLEKAYAEHSSGLTALKVDPIYDPLRSEVRFQTLLRRLGLGQ